jgi:hypothetical protein
MTTSTKIKLFVLIAASAASGWGISEIYRQSNPVEIEKIVYVRPDDAVKKPLVVDEPKIEEVISTPAPTVEPTQQPIVETPLLEPELYVRYTERIARGIEKTSPEYAAYWRDYIGSGYAIPKVTDKKLEEWADNACIRNGRTITQSQAQEWFFELYANFVAGYANRNYVMEQVARPRTSEPMKLSESWEVDDPSKVFDLAVQSAVESKCPETVFVAGN